MMRRHSWLLALVILAFPALLSAQAPPAPQTQAPQTQTPARGGNAGRGGAQGAPAAPLQISTDLTGWKSMFDGVSLKGWDGPMPLWHVENGTIAVRRTLDPPLGSVYLIWQGGQPKDFEMKLDVKLEGDGANSGVQFRAMLLGEVPDRPLVGGYQMTKWESHGYQADMTNTGGAGSMLNCCQGPRRGPARRNDTGAGRGQMTRASTKSAESGTRELVATVGDPAALRANWKPNDWNSLHIIARGRTMIYIVNGQVASIMFDDHPTLFRDSGYISIQLEGAAPNAAWFKNLWIKELP